MAQTKLHCKDCGILMAVIEDGKIRTAGIVVYCVSCDNARTYRLLNPKPKDADFGDLFNDLLRGKRK